MLINEVCKSTGLTKKAILYYEKENFISPKKLSNGYRDYSNEDIKILQEISLYRKLDISVKDIMTILKSKDKREILNRIVIEKEQKEIRLKIDKIHLERLIEGDMSINEIFRLNDEIIQEEKKSGEFIKRELKRAFPKGFGEYMAYHFSPYLNEPLDTMEKIKAWHNIVEFLDNIPQFKIPKFIQIGLASSSDEIRKRTYEATKSKMEALLEAQGEELEEYKKELLGYVDKQKEWRLLPYLNPFFNFKKKLMNFYKESGYYEVFIPNMKVLSKEYREYSEKLNLINDKLSKELGIKYDENYKIIRVDE
ncbi:MerR family transcriptional regulator [Clostridium paraputrificum]|uniref:MerR family transcriptional regulator n=1 Tax=Clostridium TaxID=1485 RepID=UPI0006C2935D|nr:MULTISPECIES: MerR family transcriptional regulator [Clostridium]MDB2089737.1 MerR family transcriptional regulator [Clostridium paraputrificum]MDB2096088.1 MerR family transcriptional regulator [Clostridium paraputrificum]MDB2104446.1 MerR family transcriptional regulator [Clostridium paraputrificum]MDB2125404.1 MerR family transcriptional regulator [Clostridium paraputrificum]MDU1180980.1 MerR family transcriptional regulator [Clostridium sp.]